MQYKLTSEPSCEMNLLYRFESSDRVRSVKVAAHENDVSVVISCILKNVFEDKEPSCHLEHIGDENDLVCNNSKPYVFKRIYLNKFEKRKVMVVTKKKKRIRRWKSPDARYVRRRWRSRSRSPSPVKIN